MTTTTLPRAALVYDFDGTLASGNMQEPTLLPELGVDSASFWQRMHQRAEELNSDQVLTYMLQLLESAREKNMVVTADWLHHHGTHVRLFEGLNDWFSRLNQYAAQRGLHLEHYVISSGLYEMIQGCAIFSEFKQVYASRFIYNAQGHAIWPGVAINYTTKTQFLFRINKGIETTWDNARINRWQPMPERPVPFDRMVFIGDGATDIPSMKMVRFQGGYSIAVFDPDRWSQHESQRNIHQLIAEDRVQFVAPADYRQGSQLDVTVQGILGRMAREVGFREPVATDASQT